MTQYDPKVIQQFADRLYARRAGAVVVSTLLGYVIGTVIRPFIHQALPSALTEFLPEWSYGAFFAVLGILQGLERASLLKLQAQTALCQMQIEINTRKAAQVS